MKRALAILLAMILSAASAVCALSEDAAPGPTAEPVRMQLTDEEIAATVIGAWEMEDDVKGYGTRVNSYSENTMRLVAEPGYYLLMSKVYEFYENGTFRITVRGKRLIGEFENREDAEARAAECEYGDEEIIVDGEAGTYMISRGYIRMEENEGNVTWLLPYYVICCDADSMVTQIKYSDGPHYDRWLRLAE